MNDSGVAMSSSSSSSSSSSRPSLKSKRFSRSTQILIATSAIFSLHSTSATSAHQYDQVINQNRLTVVSVQEPSIVFKDANMMHGFGYDQARHYANSLNVKLDYQIVQSNSAALKMVKQGKAHFALTTTSDTQTIENQSLASFSASCGQNQLLSKHGLNHNLSWVFKNADDPLTQTASGYICNASNNGMTARMASFYTQNVVQPQAWKKIQRDLHQRLPVYKASFKQSAQKYDLDWQLLAAIGYQESYLKPDSVSPTGVRGIMMLTNNTAKAMGVSNRTDPKQSIQGGARYYDEMLTQFDHIAYPDRNWFALVAYNMGPGAVMSIQKRIKAQGKNPNQWIELYGFLERNKASNGRYRQALQYVTRIRSYVERIKTTPQLKSI